ncbi:MAG: histidine kinase [Bacteroidales bacterium]|nr:histidine kinase [Bacteroidales bacterium]
MTRSIWLIVFIVLFEFHSSAQFSFYRNYTVNDGLPSSKVYDMLQDRQGYFWFATENGVSRFDGYTFTNFTKRDGLPTNSTLKLYEDFKGRIWFLSYEGTVSYFFNGKIFIHPLFDNIISPDISFLDNIYVDSTDRIYLSGFKKDLYLIEYGQVKVLERTRHGTPPRTTYLYFEDRGNGKILCFSNPPEEYDGSEVFRHGKGVLIKFVNTETFPRVQKFCLINSEGDIIISLGPELKKIRDREIVMSKTFSYNIIKLYEDAENNIWVGEEFNGVYLFRNGDLNSIPERFLHNSSVSGILQDYEGNYWFSTTENGIFLVPSIQFKTFNSANLPLVKEVILSLANYEDLLYFSTSNKGLYKARIISNFPEIDKNFRIDGTINNNINDLMVSSDGNIWISNTENLRYDLNGKNIKVDTRYRHSGYVFYELSDHSVILGQPGGYYVYKNAILSYSSDSNDFNYRTYALYENPDQSLLIGTIDGLFVYSGDQYKRYSEDNPVLNSRISDIKSFHDEVWVGTFDNGIAILKYDKINYIAENNGLSSNRIKVIFIENNESVWVGTNNGLNHIIPDHFEAGKFLITRYTIWDGLPTNEINDIICHNESLWLATDMGLVTFDPQNVGKKWVQPKLSLENVWVNDHIILYDSVHIFRHHENNFRFSFKALTFKDPGNVLYTYKLEGLDNNWIETNNPTVRLPDLKPGSYRFLAKASSKDEVWSEPVSYAFVVNKHFTQTVAFRICSLIVILGAVSIIFYTILLSQRRRESLKQQIVLAEQKALRSQMNPHFIFNSLNSIQHFIVDKDEKNASSYLSNFSNLIRRILETSKFNTISLREELENLRLYLQLEQLRFENRFNYSIEIDPVINPDQISIPTMIIQPFIENAIWHGLMPRKEKGNMQISFQPKSSEKLLIVIQDNGIGREKSAIINQKRKHHNPTGIKNIQERLALLNMLNKTNMSATILDIYDENQQAAGTKVEIIFEI